MNVLNKNIWAGVGVAIASGLLLPLPPAAAEPASEQEASTHASALGGPLTPSNSAIFQIQTPDESTPPSITLDNKEKGLQSSKAPLEWQSEHLDNQRQFDSNFSVIDVDFN